MYYTAAVYCFVRSIYPFTNAVQRIKYSIRQPFCKLPLLFHSRYYATLARPRRVAQ